MPLSQSDMQTAVSFMFRASRTGDGLVKIGSPTISEFFERLIEIVKQLDGDAFPRNQADQFAADYGFKYK